MVGSLNVRNKTQIKLCARSEWNSERLERKRERGRESERKKKVNIQNLKKKHKKDAIELVFH